MQFYFSVNLTILVYEPYHQLTVMYSHRQKLLPDSSSSMNHLPVEVRVTIFLEERGAKCQGGWKVGSEEGEIFWSMERQVTNIIFLFIHMDQNGNY